MNDWIAALNALASPWAAAMTRACWQGTLALLLVWGITRLVPSMRGGLRCWLWRLAFVKLLAGLFWAGTVALPILPSANAAAGPITVTLGSSVAVTRTVAATSAAAWTVDETSGAGTHAEAAFCDNTTATAPPDSARP